MTYRNRKFDLRIWTVVTESFSIYIYKEGYIRTCSSNFDVNASDNMVHLTNQCMQNKDKESYAKHEEGNTLSWAQLQQYFEEEYSQYGLNIEEHIQPRINDIVIDTFMSFNGKSMNPQNRKNVFELFGFDFMIDEDLRVWLIEVNTNPYLGTPCEHMRKLMPEMIDDML